MLAYFPPSCTNFAWQASACPHSIYTIWRKIWLSNRTTIIMRYCLKTKGAARTFCVRSAPLLTSIIILTAGWFVNAFLQVFYLFLAFCEICIIYWWIFRKSVMQLCQQYIENWIVGMTDFRFFRFFLSESGRFLPIMTYECKYPSYCRFLQF